MKPFLLIFALLLPWSATTAEELLIKTEKILRVPSAPLEMGQPKSPSGDALLVTESALLLNQRPWLPSLGGFAYHELPVSDWKRALLKARDTGTELLLVEVPWALHEPRPGAFDWSGNHDLARFLALCREQQVKVILRLGPTGESRQGLHVLPAWLAGRQIVTRSNDSAYLQLVRNWFFAIARECRGQLWKDGGPILGIEVENNFSGTPLHLIQLKTLAKTAGFDLPLYARSGLGTLTSPMPSGELLPLRSRESAPLWSTRLDTPAALLNFTNEGAAPAPGLETRRLNLFLAEFGGELARHGDRSVSAAGAGRKAPLAVLRHDGKAGFLFINPPDEPDSDIPKSFQLDLFEIDNAFQVPNTPVRLPAGRHQVWPVNLPLSNRITLGYATAMPLCLIDTEEGRTLFLAATKGQATEIGISADLGVRISCPTRKASCVKGGSFVFENLPDGLEPVMEIRAEDSPTVRIVLLSEEDSLALHRLNWLGHERLVLYEGTILQDKDRLEFLPAEGKPRSRRLLIYPDTRAIASSLNKASDKQEGIFSAYELKSSQAVIATAR